MGLVRPATPGFIVCLAATALFAVVTFSVPYIKSVYFLKASLTQDNISGDITFGTLGYCLTLPNGTSCSKPSVGYELNVNSLLGDDTAIQIPDVLVKWVTYALVLHIVALVLAAISAILGLLAHIREMSMAYCSSFVAGFGAAVGVTAFIFDLVLFFVTKSRINDVSGASASFGIAVWLTLAGWLCLFFAGCFYSVGRCCIGRRPRGWNNKDMPGGDGGYAEQMRLDAVKAEADRKARQKQGEVGLPAFNVDEQMQPLNRKMSDEQFVEDGDAIVPLAGVGAYGNHANASQFPGYSQAPAGSRAVDGYYNQSSGYPPRQQPQRQGSAHTQTTSGYAPSSPYNALATAAIGTAGGYAAADQYNHGRQATGVTSNYGHGAQNSSYYAHQQYPTAGTGNYAMSASDPFAAQPYQQTFDPDAYNATGYMHDPMPTSSSPAPLQNPYYNRAQAPERSYTLGGDSYAQSTTGTDSSYYPQYGSSSHTPAPMPSPAPIDTSMQMPSSSAAARAMSTSPRGPRPSSAHIASPVQEMPEPAHEAQYSDSPPVYDAATAQPPGMWSTKN